MTLTEIPREKTISKNDFLERYVKPQKPVVIEHLIEDWPAYKKWSLDYIEEVAGEKEVPLFDDRPISAKFKFNEPHQKMKMRDYIELLKSKPTNYRIFLYNLIEGSSCLAEGFHVSEDWAENFEADPNAVLRRGKFQSLYAL